MIDLDGFDAPGPKAWNVAFIDREERMWWDLWTRPGFRHVAAYGYVPEWNMWLVVDPKESITRVFLLDNDGLDDWFRAHRMHITAVVNMECRDEKAIHAKFGNWCVSTMKQLLGLKSGAWTPHGLYVSMLRNGGTLRMEKPHG